MEAVSPHSVGSVRCVRRDKRVMPGLLEPYPLTGTSLNGSESINGGPNASPNVEGEVALPPPLKELQGFSPAVSSASEIQTFRPSPLLLLMKPPGLALVTG